MNLDDETLEALGYARPVEPWGVSRVGPGTGARGPEVEAKKQATRRRNLEARRRKNRTGG